MILKVCGLKEPENIVAIASLKPDYMGFIFYEKSPRHVEEIDISELIATLKIPKVGVFVNADLKFILDKREKYKFDTVQLHGQELPSLVIELKKNALEVWKVFGIDANFDFETTLPYESLSDKFLLDTKLEQGYGGHGRVFDWNILKEYQGATPLIISGGISLENVGKLLALNHPSIVGIDINSKFEIRPGVKDLEKIKQLQKHEQICGK